MTCLRLGRKLTNTGPFIWFLQSHKPQLLAQAGACGTMDGLSNETRWLIALCLWPSQLRRWFSAAATIAGGYALREKLMEQARKFVAERFWQLAKPSAGCDISTSRRIIMIARQQYRDGAEMAYMLQDWCRRILLGHKEASTLTEAWNWSGAPIARCILRAARLRNMRPHEVRHVINEAAGFPLLSRLAPATPTQTRRTSRPSCSARAT